MNGETLEMLKLEMESGRVPIELFQIGSEVLESSMLHYGSRGENSSFLIQTGSRVLKDNVIVANSRQLVFYGEILATPLLKLDPVARFAKRSNC